MNQRLRSSIVLMALAMGVIAAAMSAEGTGTDKVNPQQSTIDALNERKALIEAQDSLLKAQAALAKDQFPAFPDKFGKSGALTVESSERDKFHVTARSAEAFKTAATKIVQAINSETGPVVLLTDADRAAISLYWAEKIVLDRITAGVNRILGKPSEPPTKEAVGTVVLGLGSLMSQLAQFGQLFRTDRSLAFTDALLPDELLLDLIAVAAKDKILYPAASVDALVLSGAGTFFGKNLEALLRQRPLLESSTKEPAAAKILLADLDALATRSTSTDPATKLPMILTIMRGELATEFLKSANGRSLSVRVVVKGGASLKTSSIWRSDRLYASGGIVATYRLTSQDPQPFGSVLKAEVVTAESGFVRIPLD